MTASDRPQFPFAASRNALQAELARTETAFEQRAGALLAAQARIRELELAQAAADAARQALEAENARQQDEIGARDQALVQARADFSDELEKLRDSAGLAEDRLRAAEKRALLEIERERAAGARFQKELDVAGRRATSQRTADPAGAVSRMHGTRLASSKATWQPCVRQTPATRKNSRRCDSS